MRLRSGREFQQFPIPSNSSAAKRSQLKLASSLPSPAPRKRPRKVPLTRRNLRLLEHESRKSMSRKGKNVLGGSKSNKTTVTGTSSGTNRSKSSTTTTDIRFGDVLAENNVHFDQGFGDAFAQPPKDLAEIQSFLKRERDSPSIDDGHFQQYVNRSTNAGNEQSFESNAWPLLEKDPYRKEDPGYDRNKNFQWTEIEGGVVSNLSDPKPDISESFRINQYPQEAVEVLGSALKPTQYRQAMPKICMELKGPDGSLDSAEKQAAFDGAVMVDSAWEAHKFMQLQPVDFLGQTQALTIAINKDTLNIYTNHAIEKAPTARKVATDSPKSTGLQVQPSHPIALPSLNAPKYPTHLEYHQYKAMGAAPRNSLEDFKKSRKYVRNAQDWARQEARKGKDDLHAHVNREADITNALQSEEEPAALDSEDGFVAVDTPKVESDPSASLEGSNS